MVATIGALKFTTSLDKTGLTQGLRGLQGTKAAIAVKATLDLSSARRELDALIAKPIDLMLRADVSGIRRQLEGLDLTVDAEVNLRVSDLSLQSLRRSVGDAIGPVTVALTADTSAIDSAIAKYADTKIKVTFDTSEYQALQASIKVEGGGGDPVDYKKLGDTLTSAIEDGFKRSRPGGGGIITGTVANVVRGAQEQAGAAFTAKSSRAFVAQIEKEFNFSLNKIGQQSAQRVAAVGRFTADRVVTRVGERVGVEGGVAGFRAQVPKVQAFAAEIIDTKAVERKFAVLELTIGKFIDNLLDDALRLKTPTRAVADIKNVGGAVVDIARTPIEGIAQRKQDKLSESFAEAERRSKFVTLPDLEGQKAVTFTIGGFAGNRGQSSPGVADRFQTLLGDKSKAVPIANPQTDTSVNVGEGKLLFVAQILERFVKQNVIAGQNDDSINAAAAAIAAKRQTPDLQVGFAGYSAGGFVANEASQILKAGGIEAPAVGVGTPRLGLTDRLDDKNFKAIISDTEQLGKLTKLFNRNAQGIERLDIAPDHKLSTYLGAPQAQKSILGQLGLNTDTPKELSGPAAFEIPSLDEDLNVTQSALAETLSNPKSMRFASQSGIYKAYIGNIQGNRDRIASLLETAQGETRETLAQYDEAFQQAEELFKGAFGVKQPTKPPIELEPKPSTRSAAATASPTAISDIPKSFIEESLNESNALLSALVESNKRIRSVDDVRGKIAAELKGKTTEILKEIGRVGGAGTLKGSKDSIISQLQEKVQPEDLARSIVSVEAITDIGPKGGQKLQRLPQTDNEKKLLDIALESEQRIKKALVQLGAAQGARREQIAEAIANESAQTAALLNRITSKSVAPETRLEAGQIKGRLAGIDNQLPTISGTARIKPADILSKIPQGAIADAGVALAGVAGAQIGSQLGIGGEMLGNLAGSLAARQGLAIGKAIARATSTLKASGQSVTPKNLLKQSQVEFLTRNAQKEIGRNLTGDLAGFALGNAATKTADLIAPGAGAFAGLTAALTGAPRVQKMRDRFIDRQEQPQPEIEGLARVDSDRGADRGLGAKLKAKMAGLFKRQRLDAEKVYQILLEETAKESGVALNPRDIPSLKVDDSKLKQLGAVGFYKIKDNQVLIEKALADSISGTVADAEKAQKALLTLVHESRHALQFDFGRLSIADIGKDNTQSPVALFNPNNVDRASQYNAARSTQIAKQQNPFASKALLGGVYRTEADAYAFEKVKGSSVVDRTLERLKAGEGRADRVAVPKIEVPKGLQDLIGVSRNTRKAFDSISEGFDSIVDSISQVNPSLGGFVGSLKGLAGAAGGIFILQKAGQIAIDFGKRSVEAAINYDRLRNSLTATTGSARAADKDIALTDTTAKDFGLDKAATRESIQQLRGSTQGTAIEGRQTEELFKAISALSATRGLSKESQGRAVTALSQIASKGGAASSEEVKGQLAEAIPGSSGIAARGLGLTQKEFSRKLNNGDIGSTEFLEAFTSQAKAESLGGATKNADNLNGSLTNLNNSTLALQESTGKAIAPALSIGAKTAAAAIDLLAKNAELLGAVLTAVAARSLIALGQSLLALPVVAKLAAGGLSAVGTAAASLAAAAAPVLVLTIAIVAATKAFDAFKAGFVASENIQQFKAFGDGAVKELDRIDKAAKGAKSAISAKGDGAEFAKDKAEPVVGFDDLIPIYSQIKQLTRNGKRAQRDTDKRGFGEAIEGFSATATGLEKPETEAEDRKSLEAAKALDKQASELRAKRNLLGNDSTKKAEVSQLDQQLRDNKAARKQVFAPAGERAELAAGKLENLRSFVADTNADQNISGEERDRRLALLDKEIKRYEEIQARQQKLGKEIGTSVNPISTLNEKLTELKLTLDDIASKSKIKLDIALADNAENLNVGLKGNQFAKNDNAIADATAQETAATEQFTQSQSAVDKLRKEVGTEELTSRLNEIKVGATGRTIGLDSSIGDIEVASKDATKDEQRALDLLKNLKEEEQKLPGLRRDAAQAKTNTFETKQAGALARIDDKAEIRGQDDAKAAAGRQIALNKELASNSIRSDEELAAKRAALEQQSVADRAATVKNRVELLNAELSNGTVSAEEYVKRRRALAGEEIQIATDASNAEVSVKQAANAKILKDLERATRDRNLKSKITNNEAQIQLAKDDLNPNISDEKLAIKSAEVNLEGTRSELSNAKAELVGLNEAFAKGALNQEQYNDQASALKGNISDLGVKEAQGELAVRKAINAELLKQFERAKQTRELESRIANNEGRKALIGRQLSGPRKLESEDVAIESAKLDITATDRQTANAQADLADLNAQFSKGLIKIGEFQDKSKELRGTLSDLSVQKATNQLALLEAQNAKTLKSFERLNTEANAKIEVRQFNRSFGAQQRQFQTGQATGLGGAAEQSAIEREGIAATIKLRTSEIAGVKRLVQQRVLTESEGRDRILGIEADIRSKRKSLLDSQISEFVRSIDNRIAAIQRASDAEQRAFNKQKTRLEQESTLIDRQSSLLNARKELANTVATGRTSALEGRAAEIGEKRNLAARLRSGDVGGNEQKEIERQIGKAGFGGDRRNQELALLEQQQAIAREIENERLSGLEEQQKFARESLALDEKRLEIAQRIAELDAKGGEAQAKSELAKSKLELTKARKTGDVDQIAAAEDVVKANQEALGAATEKRQSVDGGRGSVAEENRLKRENLKAGQRNELDAIYREGNAADRQRRLEKATLKDTLGIQSSVFGGAERNTRSLRPTSDETNKALYSQEASTAGDGADYQAEQLSVMRAMLEALQKGGDKGQTTNVFQGGQDAVQQYVALQQQQQQSKARR